MARVVLSFALSNMTIDIDRYSVSLNKQCKLAGNPDEVARLFHVPSSLPGDVLWVSAPFSATIAIRQRFSLFFNLKQNSIRLLFTIIFAFYALAYGGTVRAVEMLDKIGNSNLADRNVKGALDVLRTQIDNTRRKLPISLTNEFELSIAARLNAIQESVSNNISREYKSAMMAKQILELTEHVITLPYRKLPESVQQRKKAQQQYAAVLDRFEKAAPDRTRHLDELESLQKS